MSTNPPQLTIETQSESIPPPSSAIGGLWRRLLAFLIDSLLLGIIGAILGALLFDRFARIGPVTRMVGFCIALCYFALFESSIGGGRTIGKRLLLLKVVDMRGKPLSLEQAMLRFIVFGAPYFLNNLSLPISRTPSFVSILLGVVVFGIGGVNFYLLIFNRATRQGLHDLALKSYVVMASAEGPVITKPFWNKHWAVVGALVVLLGGSSAVFIPRLMGTGAFPQLLEDLKVIEQIDGVQAASVREVSAFHLGNSPSSKSLTVDMRWTGNPDDQENAANQAAKLILEHDPSVQQYAKVVIQVSRGYDLGISSSWVSRGFAYSPEEWRERVN